VLLKKPVETVQVRLKTNKNNRTSHQDQYTFLIMSRSVLLRMKIFKIKLVENIKTHFVCSKTLISKIMPFMEYCGEKMDEPDRPQMTLKYDA